MDEVMQNKACGISVETESENDFLSRERTLIGDEAVERLKSSRVLLFGVGGVGGYVLEALVRAGIGAIGIVDFDTVSYSNINRQIIADTATVGQKKTEAAAQRAAKINPHIEIAVYDMFADSETIPEIISSFSPDYIADAIDKVMSKICIIETAKKHGIPVISCMGTGNKLDPSRFRICDISETSMCPLAKVMRTELRKRGISDVDVLFSDEPPAISSRVPASISYVPACAGLLIAGHIIKKLAQI